MKTIDPTQELQLNGLTISSFDADSEFVIEVKYDNIACLNKEQDQSQ